MGESSKKNSVILRRRKVIHEPMKQQYDIKRYPHEVRLFEWYATLPDLRVAEYTTEYDNNAEDYVINAIVENAGGVESGWCMVYCNAISFVNAPVFGDIIFQESYLLNPIQPSGTQQCEFRFRHGGLESNYVRKIEIRVDPKHQVMECREDNNTESWLWP